MPAQHLFAAIAAESLHRAPAPPPRPSPVARAVRRLRTRVQVPRERSVAAPARPAMAGPRPARPPAGR